MILTFFSLIAIIIKIDIMEENRKRQMKSIKAKRFFIMQAIAVLTCLACALFTYADIKLLLCSVQAFVILMMLIIEGGKPYHPIFILALAAELFNLWWVHKALLLVLFGCIIRYQFYLIKIINQGTYSAGFRSSQLGEQKLAIFYPTDQKGDQESWVQTQNFFEVMYDLTFMNPLRIRWVPLFVFKLFTSFMRKIKIPADKDVKLFSNAEQPKYPIILFSHGLSSNLTSHSSYFCWLASHGYIVVSMQHNNDLIRFAYDEPMLKRKGLLTKLLYTSQSYDLQIRRGEMEAVYLSLVNGQLLRQVFPEEKDMEISSIHFNGHSFGSSTCLSTLASLYKKSADLTLLQGVICLDPWFYPLEAATLDTSFAHDITIINSETFMDQMPAEFKMNQALATLSTKNPNNLQSFVLLGSDHIFSTDFVFVCGNGVKAITKCLYYVHSWTYYSLFQRITQLSIEKAPQQQILDECSEILERNNISQIEVKKQWRAQQAQILCDL